MRIAYLPAADDTTWSTVMGVDEIDLVALGHMPGGARRARAYAPRDIDTRGLDERATHVRVLAQAAMLVPGESITVTSASDLADVLDLVHTEVPGFCMVEHRESGPQQWRAVLTRVTC